MNKYVLSFLFLLAATAVFGQSKSKVNLIYSTLAERIPSTNGTNIYKVHNGIFKQDYSTLRSDSALFYPDLNMVDAYGHVNINQGDTLNIYSNKLHYDGNTKIAVLTEHVKMIDKDATLTTDYFTYNTATRIGTYTNGGKLVNKDNVLTSLNGYYFANTRDEYFRYKVVCTTPDAVIKTDTLRYNSGSRISYFYGPTHILGKDKDTLYTENGTYNTITEQAFFGKNNLYSQGTKTLKGDSLFYDRLKGYGRAVKHVTFFDSEQKTVLKGDLGETYKADDRTVMTQHPYMIIITDDSTGVKQPDKRLNADSLLKKAKLVEADSVSKKNAPVVKNANANKQLTLKGITDSVTKKLPPRGNVAPANKKPAPVVKAPPVNKPLTLKGITDSVMKKPSAQANVKNPVNKQATGKDTISKKSLKILPPKPDIVKHDSLLLVADTLETRIITYKDYKLMLQKVYEYNNRDTSIKRVKKAPLILYTKPPKFIDATPPPKLRHDTIARHTLLFGKPAPPAIKPAAKVVKLNVPKRTAADSIKDKRKADSIAAKTPKPLSDTSRIRIINAHYKAKLFKADLQAKADSMFYSSSDSTIRCYVNPMIWTQGSQLSGDTINLQLKNKKIDNVDMYPAGFIVNIEKDDSIHFNQVSGKKIHGTFKNNKLNTLQVTGNAETIYFNRDTVKHKVTEMGHTTSGRIVADFINGQAHITKLLDQIDEHAWPIAQVKDEDKVLKGFIWKPKERPISKESLLAHNDVPVKGKAITVKPPAGQTKNPGKATVTKPTAGKTAIPQPPPVKVAKDSLAKDTSAKVKPVPGKLTKDSVAKDTSGKGKKVPGKGAN